MLVVAALAAACSDDGGPESPEALSSLPGPGTELGFGFVVPEATRRVGPVHEVGQAPTSPADESFAARLVLDGDPRAAANDLVEQAVAHDLDVQVHCGRSERLLTCDARGLRVEDRRVYERLSLYLTLALEGAREYRAGGHVVFERWEDGIPDDRGRPPDLSQPPDPLPVEPLPPPADPPDLPRPGEAFAPDDDLGVGEDLVVSAGSEVVVPVEGSGCVTGGFEASLVVTGDPGSVMADYEAQLDPLVDDMSRADTPDRLRLHGGSVGGFGVTISIDRRPDGDEPVWATVSSCND